MPNFVESPPTFFHIGIKKYVVFLLIKEYQNFGPQPNVSVFSFSNGTIFYVENANFRPKGAIRGDFKY